MEGISATIYKKIKWHWKKRGYERIDRDGSSKRRRRITKVELGEGRRRRRRFWKIKIRPKVVFYKLVNSPKRFLVWLRDAYVNMMLGLANSGTISTGYGGAVGGGLDGFGRAPLKEYDQKVLVEIYKSLLVAKSHIVAHDAVARIATEPPVVASKLAAIVE